MKQIIRSFIAVTIFLLSASSVFSQGGISISISGSSADPSAMLDVTSTTKGLLIPRMTEQERNAIALPALGLHVFNTSTNCVNVWVGNSWKSFCGDCQFSAPLIDYNDPVCPGGTLTLFSHDTFSSATYAWTGPNGFTSTLKNPSIPNVTNAAAGIYQLSVTNNGCTAPPSFLSVSLASPPVTPGAITANNSLCWGSTSGVEFSVPSTPGANFYLWSVVSTSGAYVSAGQGTTQIKLNNFTMGDTLKVQATNTNNTCGYSSPSIMYLSSAAPDMPGPISGLTSFSLPQSGVVYSISPVNNTSIYAWTVPAGAVIVSGQGTNSITVDYPCFVNGGVVTVTASNSCGANSSTLSIPIVPTSPIVGDAFVCPNNSYTYSIATLPNASYIWTVPAGATILSGQSTPSVTVNFGNSSGNISVQRTTTPCGVSNDITTLSVNNAVSTFTPNISFSGFPVTFYPTSTYPGATYSWTFPGGNPSTSTDQNPVVTWASGGTYNVSLSVDGCSPPTIIPVQINQVTGQLGFYATGSGPNGTLQSFTVPAGVNYIMMEAWGASSGGSEQGLGARMKGEFIVTPGQTLTILVGQQGMPGGNYAAGGGGGTFVTDNSNNPLIIAGGGGAKTGWNQGQPGLTGTAGGGGCCGNGGQGGDGGTTYNSTGSGAGGGFYTDGGDGSCGNSGGKSFLNGGAGGNACDGSAGHGGYGGGGGGQTGYTCGGGGGGYSGGAGGAPYGNPTTGGGGSFNAGSNQSNSQGVQSGNGMLVITY